MYILHLALKIKNNKKKPDSHVYLYRDNQTAKLLRHTHPRFAAGFRNTVTFRGCAPFFNNVSPYFCSNNHQKAKNIHTT